MTKYILDNNVFNNLLECTTEELNEVGTRGEFYIASHIKHQELKDFIQNEKCRMRFENLEERIEEIFLTLGIKTVPNHHFPFLEDNPWGPGMYPFSNNTNPVFTDVWGPGRELGTINDALIADATSLAEGILITNDGPLITKCKRASVPVMDWECFYNSI